MNFGNGGARGVLFQIKLQQLEKNLCVEQWHRQVDCPLKASEIIFGAELPPVFERQFQAQFLGSQRPRLQAFAQLIEHPAQHKCKRLKKDQRILQFNRFFKRQRWVAWNQSSDTNATSFSLKFKATLSQSFAQRYFG